LDVRSLKAVKKHKANYEVNFLMLDYVKHFVTILCLIELFFLDEHAHILLGSYKVTN
jgi:hypothetical protein